MAGRKLRYSVTVRDDRGDSHTFGPEETVPAWASKQITNPGAWADDKAADDSGDPDQGDGTVAIPPKSGRGSGIQAWMEYAAGKVPVTGEMTRDDIIAALEHAGVPTETAGD